MSVFIKLGGNRVNVNQIRNVSIAGNNAVVITFDDLSSEIYTTNVNANREIESFDKTIVQIMPCSSALYNVFENDEGGYFHERVHCLALCADGGVRSLSAGDFFEPADEASNFIGCFSEDVLKDFPLCANGE